MNRILGLLLILTVSATADTPALFQTSNEEGSSPSPAFIAKIRAGVGDEKASYASDELNDFVLHLMGKAQNKIEYEDIKCDYLNYLERLHDKALQDAVRGLPPEAAAEIRRKEAEWKTKCATEYDYDITYEDSGRAVIDIDPRDRFIRLYLHRTRYLESPPERRAELDRFNGLRVRYVRGDTLPIVYTELRRTTPLDAVDDNRQTRGKTYDEDIATLPP